MNKKNLLRLGFLSLFCMLGAFAWADDAITLPNTDAVSCTFGGNSSATDTDHFEFYTSNISSNEKYGSVTIDGTEYDHYIKISAVDGADIISFTTLSDDTQLTLVVGPNDDMTGDKYISINDDAVYVSSQVVTYTCATAGKYTINKGESGEYHVFYIGLDKEIAEVSDEGDDEEGDDTDSNVNADGSITLPNEDVVTCTFGYEAEYNEETQETTYSYSATNTDNFTFESADTYIDASGLGTEAGLTYGSVTIGDDEYEVYYKLASDASITFTTKNENTTLTLVFGPNDTLDGSDYIYITTPESSKSKQYVSSQVFTYTCETAGEYTITKGGAQLHIFYIGLDKDAVTTGINGVTLQTTGNNVYYNLAGQRVSKPTKGVYILNGKKVLVK